MCVALHSLPLSTGCRVSSQNTRGSQSVHMCALFQAESCDITLSVLRTYQWYAGTMLVVTMAYHGTMVLHVRVRVTSGTMGVRVYVPMVPMVASELPLVPGRLRRFQWKTFSCYHWYHHWYTCTNITLSQKQLHVYVHVYHGSMATS